MHRNQRRPTAGVRMMSASTPAAPVAWTCPTFQECHHTHTQFIQNQHVCVKSQVHRKLPRFVHSFSFCWYTRVQVRCRPRCNRRRLLQSMLASTVEPKSHIGGRCRIMTHWTSSATLVAMDVCLSQRIDCNRPDHSST